MHVKLLIIVCLIVSKTTLAMEENVCTNNTKKQLTGIIALCPSEAIMYAPYLQNKAIQLLNLKAPLAVDPIVSVRAFEIQNNLLAPIYFSSAQDTLEQFPNFLPLSVIWGKNDKDILSFDLGHTCITLECKQSIARSSLSFKDQLNILLSRFHKRLDVHLFDEEDLKAQGVISVAENGDYVHGPKGYCFDNILQQ